MSAKVDLREWVFDYVAADWNTAVYELAEEIRKPSHWVSAWLRGEEEIEDPETGERSEVR